jgi:hypothetical protein
MAEYQLRWSDVPKYIYGQALTTKAKAYFLDDIADDDFFAFNPTCSVDDIRFRQQKRSRFCSQTTRHSFERRRRRLNSCWDKRFQYGRSATLNR